MDKQKVAKSLLRMAKSIVGDAKKAKGTTPITADDVKVVFEQFKKITGIKFPNVRFNNAHRKEVESNNGMFKFSLSAGIIIITSYQTSGIPSHAKLVKYLKTVFGDVYIKDKDYINVRNFGSEAEKDAVILPKTSSNVIEWYPKIASLIKRGSVKQNELSKLLSGFRKAKQGRSIKITGHPKFSVVKRFKDGGGIYRRDDNLFYNDSFNFYYIKDEKEAIALYKADKMEMTIMRKLEVDDWASQDFSSPIG